LATVAAGAESVINSWSRLQRRAFRLEYLSMAWMVVEGAVAITAGVVAHSIALMGFGLDSAIELMAAQVVVWELRGTGEERQERALRLIAVTFFLLFVYVTADAVRNLAGRQRAHESVAGITVTTAALVVMPVLAAAKRRTGSALGNRTLLADAAESTFCAALSAATLAGLALNAAFGWWWADPVAALAIGGLALKEGLEAWRGEHCD
jgi:divalent metal cation (Fe/Co/Zn/Cd) transporter